MTDQVRDWWQRRSAGEQRALRLLGLVLSLAMLAEFIVFPLQRAAEHNDARVLAERQRLMRMRSQASEIAELAGRSVPPRGGGVRERVASALTAIAPAAQPVTVDAVGEAEVRVRLPEVSFDTLVGALEPMLRDTGTRVTEFSAVALSSPGMVRAELTIRR